MNGSVLYIDDDEDNIFLLRRLFKRKRPDIQLHTAMTGHDGVRVAIDDQPAGGAGAVPALAACVPITVVRTTLAMHPTISSSTDRAEGSRGGPSQCLACAPGPAPRVLAPVSSVLRFIRTPPVLPLI